jgi:hypothetical protein
MQPIGDSEVLFAYDGDQCGAADKDDSRRRRPPPPRFGEVAIRNIAANCVWDRRLRNLAIGPEQYRLPAKVREVRHLRSAGALGHDCITDIILRMGYYTAMLPTMNFHAVAARHAGAGKGAAKKTAPVAQGRFLLILPQTAAIAAFSVALGRIAADTLAGSGR